jgi:fumarate hydratase class II
LNVFKPLIIKNVLSQIRLLADGIRSFSEKCLRGIQPHKAQIKLHLENSLMLVTALTPHIGYDKAAAVAKKAEAEGSTLRQAALALGYVSPEDFDQWINPRVMV